MDLNQLPSQSIEIVEDDAVLNPNMRFRQFVKIACVVAVDRARIDSFVHAQQRHSNTFIVASGQRPETPMCVAVLGADSWMHHKRSTRRYGKDAFSQKCFAARDHDVRCGVPYEFRSFVIVRALGVENGNGCRQFRVGAAELRDNPLFPSSIA
jgi:hypothetical protein